MAVAGAPVRRAGADDSGETAALAQEWQRSGFCIPLPVIASPYREITHPVIDSVKGMRRQSPRDVVTGFIPEYVVGRWWEQLLHRMAPPAGMRVRLRNGRIG